MRHAMRKSRIAILTILLVSVVFVFAPVWPSRVVIASFVDLQINWTGIESLSFHSLHCGVVYKYDYAFRSMPNYSMPFHYDARHWAIWYCKPSLGGGVPTPATR